MPATYKVDLTPDLSVRKTINKYNQEVGMIIRQDRFSEECCLVDINDHPPVFRDKFPGVNYTLLNLRWCSCKPCENQSN